MEPNIDLEKATKELAAIDSVATEILTDKQQVHPVSNMHTWILPVSLYKFH